MISLSDTLCDSQFWSFLFSICSRMNSCETSKHFSLIIKLNCNKISCHVLFHCDFMFDKTLFTSWRNCNLRFCSCCKSHLCVVLWCLKTFRKYLLSTLVAIITVVSVHRFDGADILHLNGENLKFWYRNEETSFMKSDKILHKEFEWLTNTSWEVYQNGFHIMK